MHSLPLYKTEQVDKLAWPQAQLAVTLHSPALEVMTDFAVREPIVIDDDTPAVELERLMKQSHVKMKLVLDKNEQFVGIVTLTDLSAQHIMQKVSEGRSREELSARDFMQPKTTLHSFDYEQLSRAKVGDVVETLKNNGHHHCLVTDRESHEIRGVISVSDIARILRLPLDIQQQPTFAELSKLLAA
ncbi:CBS domain-containing protein [Salinimonas lutimaris]|uniref:CBS domain-containing protein n=1 Tax=Salinimonas lutimaris TaxID=914153 RepID=UPI0010BF91CA|nr:CBS domain-containing protein [Salinimonas lutimaris]